MRPSSEIRYWRHRKRIGGSVRWGVIRGVFAWGSRLSRTAHLFRWSFWRRAFTEKDSSHPCEQSAARQSMPFIQLEYDVAVQVVEFPPEVKPSQE
jgi:hypothetical protein